MKNGVKSLPPPTELQLAIDHCVGRNVPRRGLRLSVEPVNLDELGVGPESRDGCWKTKALDAARSTRSRTNTHG